MTIFIQEICNVPGIIADLADLMEACLSGHTRLKRKDLHQGCADPPAKVVFTLKIDW